MVNDVGLRDIPIGAEVFTADNDKLGTVRELGGGHFKINAAVQPDYWLPDSTIVSTTGNRVMLSFRKDRLGDYKRENPLAA